MAELRRVLKRGSILKHGSLLFAALLFLGIAVVASLPTQDKFALHTQGALHPWLHLFAFGILTFALLVTIRPPWARGIVVVLMLVFGWSTEFVEHLRDSWPVETRDVYLDAGGVLAGAIAGLARTLARSSGAAEEGELSKRPVP